MQNYIVQDKETIKMPCGTFSGVCSAASYPSGELEGIRLNAGNAVPTGAGLLIPAYEETPRRKFKYSVEFHKNGMVKAVALNSQQEISTPLGDFPAELVTFYDTGEINRFFPLDGKISGFWSEEDEMSLAVPLSLDLGFTQFKAAVNGIAFWKSGGVRSISIYPGEIIKARTLYGSIRTRRGLSLYESGELESLEPASPFFLKTPIGRLAAFDPNASGMHADSCSLGFEPDGRVKKLTASSNRIKHQAPGEKAQVFEPAEALSMLDDESTEIVGLELLFDYVKNQASILKDGVSWTFPMNEKDFSIEFLYREASSFSCSQSSCAACHLCGGSSRA
ncbi:MAG: hypothetical protein LBU32_29610 [Clostridiales bacterium]|jgi:hypothetical protein|nr:hypothetical protein [Clostridiales bacterium]